MRSLGRSNIFDIDVLPRSTSNVQESSPVGPEQSKLAVSAAFVLALHDSLAVGGQRGRVRRPTTFSVPIGSFEVRTFDGRVGAWRATRRAVFQHALLTQWSALSARFDELLLGSPTDAQAISELTLPFLGNDHDLRKVAFVASRIDAKLVALGLREDPEQKLRTTAEQVHRWVHQNGLPLAAIELSDSGPSVDVDQVTKLSGAKDPDVAMVLAPILQPTLDSVAARSPWSTAARRFLPTVNRPHGRETYPGLVFNFGRMGIERGGLLDAVLDQIGLPAEHVATSAFRTWLDWLTHQNPDAEKRLKAQRILGTREGLKAVEARDLNEIFIGVMASRPLKAKTQYAYLTSFRGHLTRGYVAVGAPVPHFPRGAVQRMLVNGRGLISDEPDAGALNPEYQPRIINVAHGSFQEAKDRAVRHLDDRLQRVKNACDIDIQGFLRWRAWTNEALAAPLSDECARYVDRLHGFDIASDRELQRWLAMADLPTIMAVALTSFRTFGLHTASGYRDRITRKRSVHLGPAAGRLHAAFPDLNRWSSMRAGRGQYSVFRGLLSHWYVPQSVQLAIELKLQAETGFNRHTVRNLTVAGVSIRNATVELQALKGKVEELQHGEIDGADRTLRAGLELMIDHSQNVTAFWQPDEKRLFVALVATKTEVAFGMWTCHKFLQRFVEHHGLPRFTREQLRNQKASAVYLQNGDVNEVQGLLGHESLKTTSGYLQQHVLAILNRANIAQFMRRLAASIIWAVRGEDAVVRHGHAHADVSARLLFPLAGHAAVTHSPECDAWLANNDVTIVIDMTRIRHLVAQRAYYATQWQRLRATAPEAYERIHKPRIEFAAALWEIIRDSEYGELLEIKA